MQARIAIYNERYIEMYGLSHEIAKPGCSFLELLQHRAATGNLKAAPQKYHDDLLAELAQGKVVKVGRRLRGRPGDIRHEQAHARRRLGFYP